MKNLKSLTIILLFFLFNINQAVSLEKIVFFDLDYVVSKSKAGANISKKLEKQNKKNIDVLNKEQEKLKKELEDIKKVQNIIDKKELEKKIKTHNGNVKNFNQKNYFDKYNLDIFKKKKFRTYVFGMGGSSLSTKLLAQFLDPNSLGKNLFIFDNIR